MFSTCARKATKKGCLYPSAFINVISDYLDHVVNNPSTDMFVLLFKPKQVRFFQNTIQLLMYVYVVYKACVQKVIKTINVK